MQSKLLRRILAGALLIGLAACTTGNNASNQSPSGTLSNGVSKGHPGETS